MQKSAEAADESAPVHEEAVNQYSKPIDEELMKNLSVLVGIGCEILMLLKCNVGLVC
jgi:predicted flap endonuclease-1-like 5' DNA nuclease